MKVYTLQAGEDGSVIAQAWGAMFRPPGPMKNWVLFYLFIYLQCCTSVTPAPGLTGQLVYSNWWTWGSVKTLFLKNNWESYGGRYLTSTSGLYMCTHGQMHLHTHMRILHKHKHIHKECINKGLVRNEKLHLINLNATFNYNFNYSKVLVLNWI